MSDVQDSQLLQDENSVKVIFVGESTTGKTSLINNLNNLSFTHCVSTVSIPSQIIYNIKIPSCSKSIPLSLWDTAGQERFRCINKLFFKNAKIAIIVIDITQENTFLEVDKFWYEYIKETCSENVVIGIAENKVDLFHEEKVKESTVEEYVQGKNIIRKRTSALTGIGIKELLEELTEQYVKLINDKIIPDKLIFVEDKNQSNNNKKQKSKRKKNLC